MQAEKRKNEHDNYDQTDEVNYSVHDEYSRHEWTITHAISFA
jgi:hypothetical protein